MAAVVAFALMAHLASSGLRAGSAGSSPWEVSGWLIGEGLLLILRGAVGLFDGTCDLDS
jgi:hypothetical protein